MLLSLKASRYGGKQGIFTFRDLLVNGQVPNLDYFLDKIQQLNPFQCYQVKSLVSKLVRTNTTDFSY